MAAGAQRRQHSTQGLMVSAWGPWGTPAAALKGLKVQSGPREEEEEEGEGEEEERGGKERR